ncbi:arsenate reductase [Aquabacter sp. L1I39]|uniref:arsenate reductase n=1 Tax=Aquabacter sp. L1I39 TaxID=2820278 RepID=UPI001FFCF19D|nr:arsenate reductase [Aquabacter sp. L1I39]
MKKARAALDAAGVPYAFHDYKTVGISRQKLEAWIAQVGWEKLVNKAGTTFRKLPEAERADLDAAKAVTLMEAHPSLIKRPVLEAHGVLLVGFDPAAYAALKA